jgi:hypothetical protein
VFKELEEAAVIHDVSSVSIRAIEDDNHNAHLQPCFTPFNQDKVAQLALQC